jgi:hypothetical protein
MPIRSEVGEEENYDAVRASKCGCVPRAFVLPARSSPCGVEDNKFAAVGLAALISFNLPTPTHMSELAAPMMACLSKDCLRSTPVGLLCDRSGKSRCTDQKLQSSATDARARVVARLRSRSLARAKPLRRPQRVRDRTRLPSHD